MLLVHFVLSVGCLVGSQTMQIAVCDRRPHLIPKRRLHLRA
jgi:hypothetical protein